MTLDDLIAQFRIDADDLREPYLWDDEKVKLWFAEAEAEAAIRARLLHESSNPAICQIAVTAGKSTYPLHRSLHEIDHIAFKPLGATSREPMVLISRGELDRRHHDWRDRTGAVQYAIQSDTSIRLAFTPEVDGTVYLEGYRVPLIKLGDTEKLEIHQSHHAKLISWVLYCAFSVPDADGGDKSRAAQAERDFSRYFGERPDADMRRTAAHDAPHRNHAYLL